MLPPSYFSSKFRNPDLMGRILPHSCWSEAVISMHFMPQLVSYIRQMRLTYPFRRAPPHQMLQRILVELCLFTSKRNEVNSDTPKLENWDSRMCTESGCIFNSITLPFFPYTGSGAIHFSVPPSCLELFFSLKLILLHVPSVVCRIC